MSRIRFSWTAFDPDLVHALAKTWGWQSGTRVDARDWLSERVKRPHDDFIRANKQTLEDLWLPRYAGTPHLVQQLREYDIGPGGPDPQGLLECAQYVRKCRNSSTVRHLLRTAMLRFGDLDSSLQDEDRLLPGVLVPRFSVVRPDAQSGDARQAHDFQQEAWSRLSAHLSEAKSTGTFSGLLVMPTGSGKTFTAVNWLLREVVSRGDRVLWLAHRRELLEQAAAEVYRSAASVRGKDKLRIRLVSGLHCAATHIDPADDIVLASVAALVRRRDVVASLRDRRTFVVIDEAHHAPARTYREVLTALFADGPRHLLGLTATPTRTVDRERGTLHALFGGRVLHQVEARDLILRGILARPVPVRVKTHADIEASATQEDWHHLQQFGDLGEAWLGRIADLTVRNRLIIQHYVQNQDKYGKTLVFAINIAHAVLLTEHFKAAGIRAAFIANHGADGLDMPRQEILEEFKRPDSNIQVLVNVMILTEGVDVPAIETVFLARPTSSEILVRQMIGRAMRGPQSGGTDKAYLVSFEDHWQQFREWQSPMELVADFVDSEEEKPVAAPQPSLLETLPWELIRAAAARLRDLPVDLHADTFEAVPHGWFVLERRLDDQIAHRTIAVYAHQKPCWDEMLRWAAANPGALRGTTAKDVHDEWFGDCDVPAVSMHEVAEVLDHLQAGGPPPAYEEMPGRTYCDPYEIARLVVDQDLTEANKAQLLNDRHTPLAQAMYPRFRDFCSAVEDALYELRHPEESTRQRRAVPVFEPRPDQQLRPGPTHDLHALMAEVLEQGQTLLRLPTLPICDAELHWTRRLVKGWYGMAYFDENVIRVNKLLNSTDVTAATLRFLLWHEFLHLHLRQGHTAVFRELERRWPGALEAEHELHTLDERFGVQYW